MARRTVRRATPSDLARVCSVRNAWSQFPLFNVLERNALFNVSYLVDKGVVRLRSTSGRAGEAIGSPISLSQCDPHNNYVLLCRSVVFLDNLIHQSEYLLGTARVKRLVRISLG